VYVYFLDVCVQMKRSFDIDLASLETCQRVLLQPKGSKMFRRHKASLPLYKTCVSPLQSPTSSLYKTRVSPSSGESPDQLHDRFGSPTLAPYPSPNSPSYYPTTPSYSSTSPRYSPISPSSGESPDQQVRNAPKMVLDNIPKLELPPSMGLNLP
jgi:hypothetical protein